MFANAKGLNNTNVGDKTIESSPDICKTQSLGGPVSIPYPNTKQSGYCFLELYFLLNPSLNSWNNHIRVGDYETSFRELHSELVFHNY